MTPELINNVIMQGRRLASHSWEYGTLSEALLEWYNPDLSVFGKEAFPKGEIPVLQISDVQSLSYAMPHIWTNSTILVDGDGQWPHCGCDPLYTMDADALSRCSR